MTVPDHQVSGREIYTAQGNFVFIQMIWRLILSTEILERNSILIQICAEMGHGLPRCFLQYFTDQLVFHTKEIQSPLIYYASRNYVLTSFENIFKVSKISLENLIVH